MFSKILIANRGEIAVRIMRTIKEMGIGTVAVYSEADRGALHVLKADQAVFLGDSDPTSSYLNQEKLIAAARESGAEAIHPGYGFLAENPQFAEAVKNAGLTFIGPSAETMAQLGDKTTARRLMKAGGVPVIPGMTSTDADPARLATAAEEIGYPVLIKASAGGGGKGMRVVQAAEELLQAAEEAASEAQSAFGNGAIYLEKYLDRPRHVEIQIMADSHGNVVHLFERECSIQRRHQKIIEETPSPAVDQALRMRMGEAAVDAARAADYLNAGTVEFLLDSTGEFYFLEVNTRLQVEHPITEMITGLDLVRHQIEVADGKPLPFTQEDLYRRGHAMECRIYAEDAQAGFIPSPGKVLFIQEPSGPGVRFDSGLREGFEIPVHYDPILGKLITWAEDRPSAISRMVRALKECVILGVKTQTEFLIEVLLSKPFQEGATTTHFIEEHFANWQPAGEGDEMALLGFVADQVLSPREFSGRPQSEGTRDWSSPWQTLGKWDTV